MPLIISDQPQTQASLKPPFGAMNPTTPSGDEGEKQDQIQAPGDLGSSVLQMGFRLQRFELFKLGYF